MIHRLFYTILAVLAILFVHAEVQAQEKEEPTGPQCGIAYEAIFDMEEPKIGAYNIWDDIYGVREMVERHKSGVISTLDRVVIAGEKSENESDKKDLVILELDYRGRVAWKKIHKIPGLAAVVKMIKYGGGYIVLANIQDPEKDKKGVWIGRITNEGALKEDELVFHPDGDMEATDIIFKSSSDGYIFAANVHVKGVEKGGFAVLYHNKEKDHEDEPFTLLRSYVTGLQNGIHGITPLDGGAYMAVGFILSEDGRKAGWVMQVRPDGTIDWQRQFSRGADAVFRYGLNYHPRFVALAGDVKPHGAGGSAAWLMMMKKDDGTILWQRYIRSPHNNVAHGLRKNKDGLLSLLIGSVALENQGGSHDFARLLTMDPRGMVLENESYFNAEGSYPNQLIAGPEKVRIIIGHTEVAYQVESALYKDELEIVNSENGWVINTPAAKPYEDPCKGP